MNWESRLIKVKNVQILFDFYALKWCENLKFFEKNFKTEKLTIIQKIKNTDRS